MNKHLTLIILFFTGLIWSSIQPFDYFTWGLEVFPAVLGLIILTFTFKQFQFTFLTYCFILIHSYILFVGGHYTYAEVPFFDWIKETFDLSRNNYDKVGHFAQGFIPAMIVRELFMRKNIIPNKKWLNFVVVCICLSFSAVYEFLEWWVALFSGENADAFLGTQGYIWDTQSDMFYATIGAITMLFLLAKVQDKNISKLNK
jgi:putative membrane protein|tara:strand:+ start:142627 stop:143229 length:603 start_codon:yes stop_codon:yes gene_type:complete